MPALTNSSVGSSAGTSEDDATARCPISSKKSRKLCRTSELLIFFMAASFALTIDEAAYSGVDFEPLPAAL